LDCGKWLKMRLLHGPFGAWGWGGQGVERDTEACHPSPPEKEKAALGGLLSFDLEGIFLLTPYYQDTKSSTKTGQISLRLLWWKSRGIMRHYLGFLHRLLTDRWKKLGLAKEVRNRWIGGAGSRGIRSRRRRPLKGPGKAFPVCRSGAGQIEDLGLTRQQAEAFGERTGGYASCKCPL
jgi:hypothetical protein